MDDVSVQGSEHLEETTDEGNIEDHAILISKFGKDNFVCQACGKQFREKGHFPKRHFNFQHLPQSEAKCEICRKTFKNKQSCDTHRAKYHDQKEVECGICHKIFKSDSLLSLQPQAYKNADLLRRQK